MTAPSPGSEPSVPYLARLPSRHQLVSTIAGVRRHLVGPGGQWLALLVAGRLLASAVAVWLLVLGPLSGVDVMLLAYGPVTTAIIVAGPSLRRRRAAWAVDSLLALTCVVISSDWRSPFYMLWLTTLALPAVYLPLRRAAWLAAASPLLYLAVAFLSGAGPRPDRLTSETLAIHLLLPVVLVGGLAYAAEALRRLQDERSERERLAIETERRRIAWELHDSAKQRLHAAHLLVSSLNGGVPSALAPVVQGAATELESAAADMDTSLSELREPLEGRPLHEALRSRAAELHRADGPRISVSGSAPPLSPLVSAHLYRIGCEAITNALRHADASMIDVHLEPDAGTFRLCVRDDGRGLPSERRPMATGLVAMEGRAATIGARLTVESPPTGAGTAVMLELPTSEDAR